MQIFWCLWCLTRLITVIFILQNPPYGHFIIYHTLESQSLGIWSLVEHNHLSFICWVIYSFIQILHQLVCANSYYNIAWPQCKGFIKGWVPGKLTGWDDDFASLCLTIWRRGFLIKKSVQVVLPAYENYNKTPAKCVPWVDLHPWIATSFDFQ